jgi:hypothetical protein
MQLPQGVLMTLMPGFEGLRNPGDPSSYQTTNNDPERDSRSDPSQDRMAEHNLVSFLGTWHSANEWAFYEYCGFGLMDLPRAKAGA